MPDFAAPLQRLIDEFRRLPGIGQKSAQRLAFFVLRSARDDAARLATALLDVKDNLGICAECNNISDSELCPYCRDPHRDRSQICVVEEPHNILPFETTRTFEGLYHVLNGAISPLRGIGPEQLKIKGLIDRIARGEAAWELIVTEASFAVLAIVFLGVLAGLIVSDSHNSQAIAASDSSLATYTSTAAGLPVS